MFYIGSRPFQPEGTIAGGTTERLCLGCRGWYPARHDACPACDQPPPAHNKWLRTAMLNRHLQQQSG